jgi:7-cyano-7-deazaguanine synthase
VILLSGGLDSATCLAIAREEGFDCYTISFDYGQRHRIEMECAVRLAHSLGAVDHKVVKFDLRQFGGSALTSEIEVPKNRDIESDEIPITYVPARNTIMLSFALAYAEVSNAQDIFIGVNAVDYSGYPDCRPEYIEAFTKMANLATKTGVEGHHLRIHTPLISLTKSQIIERGVALGVDYAMTSSCYAPSPEGRPCLECDSCLIRIRAFESLGLTDPLLATAQ